MSIEAKMERRHHDRGNLNLEFKCKETWPIGDGVKCIASYPSDNGLRQHLVNDHGIRGTRRIRCHDKKEDDVAANARISTNIMRLHKRVVRGGNIDTQGLVAMLVGFR